MPLVRKTRRFAVYAGECVNNGHNNKNNHSG